jgi:hypothetical protein
MLVLYAPVTLLLCMRPGLCSYQAHYNNEFMLGDLQPPQKYRREVLRVEDLSSAELAAIAAAEPPAWTRRLDHELDPDAGEGSPLP